MVETTCWLPHPPEYPGQSFCAKIAPLPELQEQPVAGEVPWEPGGQGLHLE